MPSGRGATSRFRCNRLSRPEKELRVQAWGRGFEHVQDALAQRDAPSLTAALAAPLQLPLRVDALDGDDAGLAVDVPALECDQLLRTQAGACGEDRNGREPRVEFGGHGLDMRPGLERYDLGAARLRVLDRAGGVLLEPVPANRLFEHLANRPEQIVPRALGETSAPRAEVVRVELRQLAVAEGRGGLPKLAAQLRDRGRIGLVLLKEAVDELGQGRVASGGCMRVEDPRDVPITRRASLTLRLEPADLPPTATFVLRQPVRSQAAAQLEDAPSLASWHPGRPRGR